MLTTQVFQSSSNDPLTTVMLSGLGTLSLKLIQVGDPPQSHSSHKDPLHRLLVEN